MTLRPLEDPVGSLHSRSRAWTLASALVVLSVPLAGAAEAELRAELYTMGPGDFLFTKFGHAALCLVEDGGPDGVCYNYGTTDFSRPIGLGWDVIRGRALFQVSVSTRSEMLSSFQLDDRTIYRQVLPLGPERIRVLSRRLALDALPENREYVYNHFLENCSTRPRDLIDEASGGKLRGATLAEPATYRRYARRGLGHDRVLLILSDLVIGRWADQPIDAFGAMFLPEVLRESVSVELGVEADVLYERRAPLPPLRVDGIRREAFVVAAAIVAMALLIAWRGGGRARLRTRRFAGAIMGLLGSLLVALALLSALPELRRNELMLVFLPFDFLLISGRRGLAVGYAAVRLVGLVVVAGLALAGVLLQPIGPLWTLAFGLLVASLVGGTRPSRAPVP